MQINALGDNCATHITLDDQIAKDLGMSNPRHTFTVGGQGGYEHAYQAFKHELEFLNPQDEVIAHVVVYCYPKPAGTLKAHDWGKYKNKWFHLKDVPIPSPVGDGLIKMIIGNQLPGALASLREHRDKRDLSKPIARETPVGIFCFGRMNPEGGPEKEAAQIHMMRGRMIANQIISRKSMPVGNHATQPRVPVVSQFEGTGLGTPS